MSQASTITEWVGVEPNNYFAAILQQEKEYRGVTFPTRTVWKKGEDDDLDISPGSFDYVVGVHVLCSVDSTRDVLKQVARALKPGGTYYFMEHVAAPVDSSLYYQQLLLQPFINILGNGCQFKELWKDISDPNVLPGFKVELTNVTIPTIPIPQIRPHIVGKATKL